MLVLSRKLNESIHIGDDIRILVVRTTGKGVRLAIQAPTGVQVLRSELVGRSKHGCQVCGSEHDARVLSDEGILHDAEPHTDPPPVPRPDHATVVS